jgi:integrase
VREREMLKALEADLGDELLSHIDPARTKLYMARRVTQVSARTVNREVDLLKGMLRDACPKYLNASPIAGLRRLRTVKPKRRLMTAAEERRLLKVGDVVDRALLIVAVDTLMRLGDLLELTRDDRDGRWLYVKDPKGGEPAEVALSPRAAAALDRVPATSAYYFAKFRRAENPRDWPGSVRQRMEYLCREADVPYGKKAVGLTFHWSTRRTGATRLLVKRGVPLPAVQAQGMWKTPDVLLDIYAEADRRDKLRAVSPFPRRSRARRKRA